MARSYEMRTHQAGQASAFFWARSCCQEAEAANGLQWSTFIWPGSHSSDSVAPERRGWAWGCVAAAETGSEHNSCLPHLWVRKKVLAASNMGDDRTCCLSQSAVSPASTPPAAWMLAHLPGRGVSSPSQVHLSCSHGTAGAAGASSSSFTYTL